MPNNGLRAHGFHADEAPEVTREISARAPTVKTRRGPVLEEVRKPDLEMVARKVLSAAFEHREIPSLTRPTVGGQATEFSLIGVDWFPTKETRTVRFKQTLNSIPIFGSLITVELDGADNLVSLESELAEPSGVDPHPAFGPVEAVEILVQLGCLPDAEAGFEPELSYYYDTQEERWRLVYIARDVWCPRTLSTAVGTLSTPFADVVVDAHSRQLIDLLPRACAATVTATDALNITRQFVSSFDPVTGGEQLIDPSLNVHTRDFRFQDIQRNFSNLPGHNVLSPPRPWNPAAVSAHANAGVVASFLRNVLGRANIDGRGGPIVSSINCVWAQMGSNGQDWPQSFWIKNQVVHGQRQAGGQFRTFAAALDMVGHEFFHGVTQYSSGLILQGESGALNESYSDIFGVLIANGANPNLANWRWELGVDTGQPVRDLRRPGRFRQPEHFSQYQHIPLNVDSGGIHTNSGIHNKAAFNIITSTDPQGRFLFNLPSIARIFYHALSRLGQTALFSTSRQWIAREAQTLLRNDPQQGLKLKAISDGFAAAGIL